VIPTPGRLQSQLIYRGSTGWAQILAFLHTTNRVIKTIARDAYGFRSPVNQVLRTRTATTRKARGHLSSR
jgi:transposase